MTNTLRLVLHAAAFAGEAHRMQRRKASDQPYINHLLRTALMAEQSSLSPEAVSAALLHDVIEDTPVTVSELQEIFPNRVVELVRILTQWWPDHAPKETKDREKPKYYGKILQDSEAIQIKLLDRADNLRDIISTLPRTRRWAQKYLQTTQTEILPLYDACQNDLVKEFYSSALRDLSVALEKS